MWPLSLLFALFGAACFYFGLLSLFYMPLALTYPFWERRILRRARTEAYTPSVTILVPAYNEERTIALCIQSILKSDYPDFEVIVINDGSTDGTERALQRHIDSNAIRHLVKDNGGKASALNRGLAEARGEIVLFTDADTLFERNTIRNGISYFVDPRTQAVGGNDTPLRPQGLLQKMLVVTSHIGTGYVRRALSMANILPIIPGNLGLVRTDTLRRIGGFRNIWGEDLELTFRLHRHDARIVYGAQARVLAECPNNLRGLWRQRVRWTRSYMKIARLYKGMILRPRYGLFGWFLPTLTLNLIAIPLVQWFALALLPFALHTGLLHLKTLEWIAYLGVGSLILTAVTAILLDKSPRDLLYLPYLAVLLPLSHFYNAIVVYSLWAEFRSRSENWNKPERRSVLDLSPASAPAASRRSVVFNGGLFLGGGLAGGYALQARLGHGPSSDAAIRMASTQLAAAIHFADWTDWRDSYRLFMQNPASSFINRVAISAGRPDWTYFRWDGQRKWWSDHQRSHDGDMLDEAVSALRERGFVTTTILDVLAPRYVARHPQYAAIHWSGWPSREFVCSTWLAAGEFGDLLTEACDALARHNQADSINITELFYDSYCFCERCKGAFADATGRGDWPRRKNGQIDRDDPAIGIWRSRQVASILARLSATVERASKNLFFDVRISRSDFLLNSMENGQDYPLLAPFVDQFVVWDYFALDHIPAEESQSVASYMSRTLGAQNYWHSIGLWGASGSVLTAEDMKTAMFAAVRGGARKIWLTPAHMLRAEHWRVIRDMKEGGSA
ncbi:Glycosyltransferase, catalytic subunit of cellulose synthase and poly-beta-1,6-N-acetylglucosamine synthase [Sphingobium faniae]|nr:Glycosyltransferase, catalytic subunit of cellulose synthase and poly-beta-1,6-N-acetylglucosamine synthase [Sphingobium faniae]